MTRAALAVLLLAFAAVSGAGSSAAGSSAASFVPFVAGGHQPGECEPSYPTICLPPPPPDLDCPEIPYTDFLVVPPDAHGLDRDEDGIGCESSAAVYQPPRPFVQRPFVFVRFYEDAPAGVVQFVDAIGKGHDFHQFVFVPDFYPAYLRPRVLRSLPAFQLALKSF